MGQTGSRSETFDIMVIGCWTSVDEKFEIHCFYFESNSMNNSTLCSSWKDDLGQFKYKYCTAGTRSTINDGFERCDSARRPPWKPPPGILDGRSDAC